MRTICGIGMTAAMCWLWACGTTASPTPVTPTTSSKVATAIRIAGPATIAPGATGQFTAIASFSDGSSEGVTTSATWVSSSPLTVLQFMGAGAAQAVARGEARVTATLNKASASLTVLVLEPGTFRVAGTVTEASGIPLDQAAIGIASGTGAGLQTTSDTQGRYALYGAAGAVELRASAEGFDTQVHRTVVTDQATNDFALTPLTPPADLSGSWILTLSASPGCRANLPAVARERVFEAGITQQGAAFQVTLTSPTILVLALPLTDVGRIVVKALSFTIVGDTNYGDWSFPDLGDRLSPTESLGFSGRVQGTVTGSEIRATMQGDLEYWPRPSPAGPPTAICRAADHVVVLHRK